MSNTTSINTAGLRFAVLDEALPLIRVQSADVLNGDVLTCPERCCAQRVMGSSTEGASTRLLVARDGETWDDRVALTFPNERFLYIVRGVA